MNASANMLRSKFYVCPVCGNSIHSMGEAVIQCHGIILTPCQAEKTDENSEIHNAIVSGTATYVLKYSAKTERKWMKVKIIEQ